MARLLAALALCCAITACRDTTEGVRTQFVGSYAFTPAERRAIARIAGDAAIEARRHLPTLARQITLQVRSGTDVIAEVGAGATVVPPDWIQWTVNAADPRGVLAIAESQLRPALFHEFHHLVRGETSPALMDQVVSEGLATAFERDFAGTSPPWGDYPDDVAEWVKELQALPPTADRMQWLFRHPDGRRWIGMRAGTYLADAAMKTLQRTSADLVSAPASEILEAARR